MSDNYVSIREDVLRKLERELPYLQKEFDIETIGIFGSVSRGRIRLKAISMYFIHLGTVLSESGSFWIFSNILKIC